MKKIVYEIGNGNVITFNIPKEKLKIAEKKNV